MVMVAIVLVVLMIFAALAVDIGNAYSTKRLDQNSVDAATLAGGVEFRTSGDFDKMVASIQSYVNSDLGTTVTQAQWNACSDPNMPANLKPISNYTATYPSLSCISFGQATGLDGSNQVRVRLPDVAVATTFGRVMGIKSILTHAVAMVKVGTFFGGSPMPWDSFVDASGGDIVCGNTGSQPTMDPCSHNSGEFGGYDPYYYKINCDTGNTAAPPENGPSRAQALGLDHLLSQMSVAPVAPLSFTSGGVERMNGGGNCTEPSPNSVNPNTGNGSGDLVTGLITGNGSSGDWSGNTTTGAPTDLVQYPGRFEWGPFLGDGGTTYNTQMIAKTSIDNRPLWTFLDTSVFKAGTPAVCTSAAGMSALRSAAIPVANALGYTPEGLMQACLRQWESGPGGPIFNASVGLSHRVASIPQFWETFSGSGHSTVYHVKQFVPLFLDRIEGQNGTILYAGDGNSTNKNLAIYKNFNANPAKKNINAIAGMMIPCGAFPTSVCVPSNSGGNQDFGTFQGVSLTQ